MRLVDFCEDSGVGRVRGHRGTCLGRIGSGWGGEVYGGGGLGLLLDPAARRAHRVKPTRLVGHAREVRGVGSKHASPIPTSLQRNGPTGGGGGDSGGSGGPQMCASIVARP